MCRNLNVTRAGYYAWRSRKSSERDKRDRELAQAITAIHLDSRKTYGRPRIHVELRKGGFCVAGKRIARLMREQGIVGKKRIRSKATSTAPGILPAAPNVLNRQFNVEKPNIAWVSDITQFPTAEGWLYLAVVIELYSRLVVGWSMSKSIDSDLVISALQMGLKRRKADNLIVHSDRGRQYTSNLYYAFLEQRGLQPSMSRKGDCWDNAVAESFFSTIKVELAEPRVWRTRHEGRSAIFEYIEAWYNTRRLHSANGYLSPKAFESAQCVI
jgi:transposase InsO family protein